jgi:hypothetical protein
MKVDKLQVERSDVVKTHSSFTVIDFVATLIFRVYCICIMSSQ